MAAGLLVLATLPGCASDQEQYCDALREQKTTLTGLADRANNPDTDIFAESLAVFQDLKDEAPDDVADEWDTLIFAWQDLEAAFDRAGTTPAEYDPAKPPAGVSDAEAKALEDAAAELRSPRVVDAGDGIEQHASDVCKVDLGL